MDGSNKCQGKWHAAIETISLITDFYESERLLDICQEHQFESIQTYEDAHDGVHEFHTVDNPDDDYKEKCASWEADMIECRKWFGML